MSSVEDRLRRVEDVEAIRTLDAVHCGLLDDGDWPTLVQMFAPGGVFDGLRRVEGRADLLAFFAKLAEAELSAFWHHVPNPEVAVNTDTATVRSLLWQPCVVDGVPHVAAGRYADELLRTRAGWRYRVEQVRSSYWAPLTDTWDTGRHELASAVPPEVRA